MPISSSSPRRVAAGAAAVAALIVVFCLGLSRKNPGTFFNDDYQISILPVLTDVARSWSEGHWPLLSPYSWACANLAGEYQYGTFSLFVNLLVVVVWKFPLEFAQQAAALSITHLAVLGAGAYLLARERRLPAGVAAGVALIASLNGWNMGWSAIDWFGALAAHAWLPWCWWAFEVALRKGGTRKAGGGRDLRWGLLPGPFVYLLLTAGFPYTVVMLMLVTAWLAARTWFRSGHDWRRWWPLAAGWGLGLLWSAPAWLSLLDAVHGSGRATEGVGVGNVAWSVPVAALPALILPNWTVPWPDFANVPVAHPVAGTGGRVRAGSGAARGARLLARRTVAAAAVGTGTGGRRTGFVSVAQSGVVPVEFPVAAVVAPDSGIGGGAGAAPAGVADAGAWLGLAALGDQPGRVGGRVCVARLAGDGRGAHPVCPRPDVPVPAALYLGHRGGVGGAGGISGAARMAAGGVGAGGAGSDRGDLSLHGHQSAPADLPDAAGAAFRRAAVEGPAIPEFLPRGGPVLPRLADATRVRVARADGQHGHDRGGPHDQRIQPDHGGRGGQDAQHRKRTATCRRRTARICSRKTPPVPGGCSTSWAWTGWSSRTITSWKPGPWTRNGSGCWTWMKAACTSAGRGPSATSGRWTAAVG